MNKSEVNFNFKNKNFVLTGAGKGIGFATLQRLYDADAQIAVIWSKTITLSFIN